jgi:hypothetical protein
MQSFLPVEAEISVTKVNGRTNGRTDKRTDRLTDGRTNRLMDKVIAI